MRVYMESLRHPKRAQRLVWGLLQARLRQAPFWRERMGSIPALKHFPITDYVEDYREAAEACLDDPRGTISPFTGEPILFWAETTGSMDRPKVHPWSDLILGASSQVLALNDRLRRALRPSEIDRTLRLAVSGTRPVASGLYRGPLSGLLARHDWSGPDATPDRPHPGTLLDDPVVCARWQPAYALAADYTRMVSNVPSRITLFVRAVADDPAFHLDALAGKVKPPAPFDPIAPKPGRLEQVRRALADGPATLDTLFPELHSVSVWKSGTAGLQLPALRQVLGPEVTVLDSPFVSSEAVYTVSDPNREYGGPLALPAGIFEFLEAGARPHPDNLLSAWQIEQGRLYEVITTSLLGYVRYRQGDLVRCLDFEGATPVIAYEGRAERELSLGNVTVSEHQVMQAGAETMRGTWFLAPLGSGFALFVQSVEQADARAFDDALGRVNAKFAGHRQHATLPATVVQVLPPSHPRWQAASHDNAKPQVLYATAPSQEE